MSIKTEVEKVIENVAEAARSSGRSPEDITIVAATKMNSADRIRQAIEAGIKVAGENRVQELLEKDAQGAYEGAKLHFIGTFQKNKVKYLVGRCDLIQSVDSVELMELISARAEKIGTVQDILIEVNIGREAAKSGVLPENLGTLIEKAAKLPGLHIRGLMAIPPISKEKGGNRNYFKAMYQLFVDIRGKKYDNVSMDFLSIGMSADYEDAIMEGANMVRIGTAIFGQRDYSRKS